MQVIVEKTQTQKRRQFRFKEIYEGKKLKIIEDCKTNFSNCLSFFSPWLYDIRAKGSGDFSRNINIHYKCFTPLFMFESPPFLGESMGIF